MRLHRLLGIIMLIDSRGTMKARNLAEILETSERSIYRDIDILCEAGIPITSIPGPNGGYSFMEGYKINSNSLGSGDVVNLLLSSMGIRPENNTEASEELSNAFIKLESSVSKEHRQEIVRAKESFFVDSEPWWGKRHENQYVDLIKKSVLNLNKLKIHYKKYTGEVSERVIRPYGVVIKNSQWYMVAFCELKNEIRVFKCARITDIEVLEESFIMPESFYLKDFWKKSKKQFVTRTVSESVSSSYPVKLKFYEEKKKLLEGFNICSTTEDNGYFIYDIDMISFTTACNVIFPMSDRLEVLDPTELREFIINKSKKICDLYKIN